MTGPQIPSSFVELTRVVIAHSQSLFRLGIHSLLEKEPGILILAEAADERELLEVLEYYSVDVLLLDPSIPLLYGQLSCATIKQRYPAVQMIILSSSLEEQQAAHYVNRGASLCLDKNCGKEALVRAIIQAHRQKPTAGQAADAEERKVTTEKGDKNYLTEREVEVLFHICKGKTNKEIAEALNITIRTVDFHRKNLYEKTQTETPAALAIYAIRHGIHNL